MSHQQKLHQQLPRTHANSQDSNNFVPLPPTNDEFSKQLTKTTLNG
jgi:hypothetical protein